MDPGTRRTLRWLLLALPGFVFLIVAFVVPIGDMVWRSFTDPSPANYVYIAKSSTYRRALWTTVWISGMVTAVTILLGYLYAYAMRHAGAAVRGALMGLVLMPFWSSLLVRTYAWTVLLRPSGVVNFMLKSLGLIEQPLALMNNTLGATVGMTHILLPFMVLPVYAVMLRTDQDLVRAAMNLGATPWQAFWKVYLPLTASGLYAGSLLVFVLSLGFYITPAILGNPRQAMLGQIVAMEVNDLLRFGTASALGVVLLVIMIVLLRASRRFANVSDLWGASQ